MTLSSGLINRFQGLTSELEADSIKESVGRLVKSWKEDGFNIEDILEYLGEEFFDNILVSVEYEFKKEIELEAKRYKQALAISKIAELAKESGLDVVVKNVTI